MLERIQEIMKPYFDKEKELNDYKESIDLDKINKEIKEEAARKHRELYNEFMAKVTPLETSLETIKNNREEEINKFIDDLYSNVAPSHIAIIRKDLEEAYDAKIKEKQTELDELRRDFLKQKEDILNPELVKSVSDYTKVYEKMLEESKYDIHKQLLPIKEEQQKEIKDLKSKVDLIDFQMYKYLNENPSIKMHLSEHPEDYASFDYYRILVNEKNELESKLMDVQSLDRYFDLVDNSNYNLIYLNPQEQKLYDELTKKEEVVEETVQQSTEPKVETELVTPPEFTYNKEDIDTYTDGIDRPNAKIKNDKVIVDSFYDLVKLVYSDIKNAVENIKGVKLEGSKSDLFKSGRYLSVKDGEVQYETVGSVDIKDNTTEQELTLPNGEYVNASDFEQGLDKYYEQNKGKRFIVKKRFKKHEFGMTDETLNKFKEALTKVSRVKLLKDSKITNFDLRKVFGKGKNDESSSYIGDVKTSVEGDYISRLETVRALGSLFKENEKKWLQSLKESFSKKAAAWYDKNTKEEEILPAEYLDDGDDEKGFARSNRK